MLYPTLKLVISVQDELLLRDVTDPTKLNSVLLRAVNAARRGLEQAADLPCGASTPPRTTRKATGTTPGPANDLPGICTHGPKPPRMDALYEAGLPLMTADAVAGVLDPSQRTYCVHLRSCREIRSYEQVHELDQVDLARTRADTPGPGPGLRLGIRGASTPPAPHRRLLQARRLHPPTGGQPPDGQRRRHRRSVPGPLRRARLRDRHALRRMPSGTAPAARGLLAKAGKNMARFSTVNGNIFNSGTHALVNPVNCVGTMGAGLARQFRDQYPAMYQEYLKLCRRNTSSNPARVQVFQHSPSRTIVNLPTKDHWRNPSTLAHVESGLIALNAALADPRTSRSVAVPALGTGLGGLKWPEVLPLIHQHLTGDDLTVEIFPPR